MRRFPIFHFMIMHMRSILNVNEGVIYKAPELILLFLSIIKIIELYFSNTIQFVMQMSHAVISLTFIEYREQLCTELTLKY